MIGFSRFVEVCLGLSRFVEVCFRVSLYIPVISDFGSTILSIKKRVFFSSC